MATYSIRCRHHACRHRRVSKIHPDKYKVVPRCPACGHRKGWRIEQRAYNKRDLCECSGPEITKGQYFPHNKTHPYCDHHPHGFYNQARAKGVAHEDIPHEYRPESDTLVSEEK
jgi:hypothetical protein